MTYPFDLGQYSRKVTTASPDAQLWFDRGLLWSYGFNHEEAIACYEKALKADPNCGMARWGIAYALAPNYNKQWEAMGPEEREAFVTRGRAELERAAAHAGLPDWEAGLMTALQARVPPDAATEDIAPFNDAYAVQMREVQAAHPEDLELTAIFAEALMNRTPWQLWDIHASRPAEGADTEEAIKVLESAFREIEGAKAHPGLLHMYLHLMEMSPFPERALWAGDILVDLVPDAGHLAHMATHVDVLCGSFHDVVARNSRAIAADRRFVGHAGLDNFYTVYYCHNLHFMIYGAMFLGRSADALEAAAELKRILPERLLRRFADWFESFYGMDLHVLVRFGRWQELTKYPLPKDPELYAMTTALVHYARGVAHSALGNIDAAEAERDAFRAARDAVPESRMLFNNTCRDILKIAEAMLEGELAYRRSDYDAAFTDLRRAVELDDNLPYDEPWGWMQPARHALGALLLEQGRVTEAEAVYRADLGLDAVLARPCQHPDNMWSLHGLHECLRQRGAEEEARMISQRLAIASARADTPPVASCFCRMERVA